MIKVPLPFGIGEVIWQDQSGAEQVREHPVLDIGSSYSGLKAEVRSWLDEHCQRRWQFGFNNRTYELRFNEDEDATLFRLRWL